MRELRVNTIISAGFGEATTNLIHDTLESRGIEVLPIADLPNPTNEEILDCDAYIDRSTIIDPSFYKSMSLAYFKRKSAGMHVPIMVDNPVATMLSLDKRKTHKIMPNLIPESYDLDGTNNETMIRRFAADQFVVIKEPCGWRGTGVELLTVDQALDEHKNTSDKIVQKYVPFKDGVGRVITLNYDGNFTPICAFLKKPNSWRTGEGTTSEWKELQLTEDLLIFARDVTKRSGLYLNGFDFINHNGRNFLLEVNAAPDLFTPQEKLGADVVGSFVTHLLMSINRLRQL